MRPFTISAHADLEQITAAAAVSAPFVLPLYRAARDGLINLIQPERSAQVPIKMLERPGRAVVVLIGDDDYRSTGPHSWACALRVRRWALGGMVHAAGGETHHYEAALANTLMMRRFVMVETNAAHQKAWHSFLNPKMPTMSIIARDGIHPATPRPEAVN